jgi:glucose-6-phosphate isomerase
VDQALEAAIAARLVTIDRDRIVERIWEGDHTVWSDHPEEVSDRLGWLRIQRHIDARVPEFEMLRQDVIAEGFTTAVLLGMGGSSLAPEVLYQSFGPQEGGLRLIVLDSTDPRQLADTEADIDLDHTLFIVSSKSGSTVETLSHLAYFWEKLPHGRHFIAITDYGTGLERIARDRDFRAVFINPPDIGGRYSALSCFGLVPAVLCGIDAGLLLEGAERMAAFCDPGIPARLHPGAWLGAALGEAARHGRDKLTLVLPPEIEMLGHWIEQLVAESTGKEGEGIVPVEGELLGDPAVYGNDRVFVALGDDPSLGPLQAAGQPVFHVPFEGPASLGAEFWRWEFATAIACYVLGVNPFDQPNVQEAKEATAVVLAGGGGDPATPPLSDVLGLIGPGDYLAILAYLPRNDEVLGRLQRVRHALRDRYRVATTVGFGPRFLHSTGQLHKGGPNTGVFIQVVDEPREDRPVPGQPFTFGELEAAQALGDLDTLRAHGRRVARVSLEDLEGAAL